MKANYFKFGIFIVIATALLVTAIVILGSRLFTSEGEYFETYFNTSVAGLSKGAPVELRGVEIGEVKSIGFASEVYEMPPDFIGPLGEQRLVRVVFVVNRRFLGELTASERQIENIREIRGGLRLRLESNFLTGKSLIQGIYVDPNKFPIPELAWKPKFTFVPSVPSQLATLTDSLTSILAQVKELDLKGLFRHLDGLVLNANDAVTEVRTMNKSLQQLVANPDKGKEQANIAVMVDEMNTTLHHVNLLIMTQTPRIESTLENLQKVSSNLKEFSENLKRNPSELLLSSPPPKSELQK